MNNLAKLISAADVHDARVADPRVHTWRRRRGVLDRETAERAKCCGIRMSDVQAPGGDEASTEPELEKLDGRRMLEVQVSEADSGRRRTRTAGHLLVREVL